MKIYLGAAQPTQVAGHRPSPCPSSWCLSTGCPLTLTSLHWSNPCHAVTDATTECQALGFCLQLQTRHTRPADVLLLAAPPPLCEWCCGDREAEGRSQPTHTTATASRQPPTSALAAAGRYNILCRASALQPPSCPPRRCDAPPLPLSEPKPATDTCNNSTGQLTADLHRALSPMPCTWWR